MLYKLILISALVASANLSFVRPEGRAGGPPAGAGGMDGMGMGMNDMGMGMGPPPCLGSICCQQGATPNAVFNDIGGQGHNNVFSIKSCDGITSLGSISPGAYGVPLCLPSHSFVVSAEGGLLQPNVAFEVVDLTLQGGSNYSAVHISVPPYTASSKLCIQCSEGKYSHPLGVTFFAGTVYSIAVTDCYLNSLFNIDLTAYPGGVVSKQDGGLEPDFFDLRNACLPDGFVLTSDTGSDFATVVYDWNSEILDEGISEGGAFWHNCVIEGK